MPDIDLREKTVFWRETYRGTHKGTNTDHIGLSSGGRNDWRAEDTVEEEKDSG